MGKAVERLHLFWQLGSLAFKSSPDKAELSKQAIRKREELYGGNSPRSIRNLVEIELLTGRAKTRNEAIKHVMGRIKKKGF